MSKCLPTRSPRSARTVLASRIPIIRSESRTDDTSGFVTTIASSAKRIASVAPRSMPAGTSQDDQAKLLSERGNHPKSPFLGGSVLVARVKRGNQCEFVEAFVANKALKKFGNPLRHIKKIKNPPPFGTHHQVQVSQADV